MYIVHDLMYRQLQDMLSRSPMTVADEYSVSQRSEVVAGSLVSAVTDHGMRGNRQQVW